MRKLLVPAMNEAGSFPVDALPPNVQNYVREVAAFAQTPIALPSCCALATLSASLGRGLFVRNRHGTTRGNLFILVIASSGTGKTQTFAPVTSPVFQAQRAILAQREKASSFAKAGQLVWDKKIRKLTAVGAECEDPNQMKTVMDEIAKMLAQKEVLAVQSAPSTVVCEDVTSERLAVLLAENGETLFSASPDAGQPLNVLLGRYNRLRRTDDTLYLKGYSGDFCRVDRTSRRSVLLNSPCLTLLWLVQPEKLDAIASVKSLTEGGFLPRVMLCEADGEPVPDRGTVQGIAPAAQEDWGTLVLSLFHTYHQSFGIPHGLEMCERADEILRKHHNQIVERRRLELADADSYAARWNEWAWRLVLVLHAAAHGANSHNVIVEARTAEAAVRLANWFAEQQLQLLAHSRAVVKAEKQKAVYDLLRKKPEISARDVQLARVAARSLEARALLAQMEAEGKLRGRDYQPSGGGHTVRFYSKR